MESEIKKCVLLCSNCHKEEHYKANRNGLIVTNFKIDRGFTKCSLCGYRGENLASLHFHHNNSEDKSFNPSSFLKRQINVSLQDFENEIGKCSIICSNCHLEEHINKELFYKLENIIYHKIDNYKETRKPLDVEEVKKCSQ